MSLLLFLGVDKKKSLRLSYSFLQRSFGTRLTTLRAGKIPSAIGATQRRLPEDVFWEKATAFFRPTVVIVPAAPRLKARGIVFGRAFLWFRRWRDSTIG
jgi:hypothetical protein